MKFASRLFRPILSVLWLLSLVHGQTAQTAGKSVKPAVARSSKGGATGTAAKESPNPGGLKQGIKVHGHWTIEVRNADGTLARHVEFENSLFPGPALALILSRQSAVGYWSIALFPGDFCGFTNGNGCSISEPGNTFTSWPSTNLTISQSGNSFVLSGSVLATNSGTINLVQTDSWVCPATFAPNATCEPGTLPINPVIGGNDGFIFTSASLSPGISVSAGQTVAVTVNISFS